MLLPFLIGLVAVLIHSQDSIRFGLCETDQNKDDKKEATRENDSQIVGQMGGTVTVDLELREPVRDRVMRGLDFPVKCITINTKALRILAARVANVPSVRSGQGNPAQRMIRRNLWLLNRKDEVDKYY